MFTGIITDIGVVRDIEKIRGDRRLWIETSYEANSISPGDSISCSGCCLTVVDRIVTTSMFAVDVSEETISKTTIGEWKKGTGVNLERSVKLGGELGGHLVSGHVDGVATVVSIIREGDSHRCVFKVPDELSMYIAPKGSVALGGVSLTVNEVNDNKFGVNIIPYTWSKTTIGSLSEGEGINIEVDMLARYVARILGKDKTE